MGLVYKVWVRLTPTSTFHILPTDKATHDALQSPCSASAAGPVSQHSSHGLHQPTLQNLDISIISTFYRLGLSKVRIVYVRNYFLVQSFHHARLLSAIS